MESGCRTRKRSLLALFLLLFLLSLVNARTLSAQEPALDLLLLEVRLDQTVLSSAMPAYDVGPHTLVPLGELARLLGIAIETQPDAGTASGFILSEGNIKAVHPTFRILLE